MKYYNVKELNEEQKKPVYDTEGAVMVLAGAGSGKTRVLTTRISYIINNLKVMPYHILAITFTNKAADEMKNRLSNLVIDPEELWVSTIHSMSVKILRANAVNIGYTPNFTIYDDTDKERILKRIILDYNWGDNDIKSIKMHISIAKNEFLKPHEYMMRYSTVKNIREYTEIMELYNKAVKESNAMDFDDLLYNVYQLLLDFPSVLEEYAERFEYIHVDEFQDTNAIQYKIIKLLASVNNNLFVVGDDDQSIYSWRGAKISNMLNFDKDFPKVKIYKLQQNYRSTKNILNLANGIIKYNKLRHQKYLWTQNDEGVKPQFYIASNEEDEADYTASQIRNLIIQRNCKPSDFAVLMRVNALSRAYEQAFAKYNIPFKVYGGYRFFERKEIKDITAYLKLVNNPFDNEAFLRVINFPKRGIGEKTIQTIRNHATKIDGSLFDAAADILYIPNVSEGAKTKVKNFVRFIADLILTFENNSLSFGVKELIRKAGFYELYMQDNEENRSKKMNIDEFLNSVVQFEKMYPKAKISDYLNTVTLSSDIDEINDDNAVTIATIHAVKGLEFNNVFICGLDNSIFPLIRQGDTPENLEEERRLMYVAITRAKERVFLTRARERFIFGDRRYTMESLFIKELSEQIGIKPMRVVMKNGYYGDTYNAELNKCMVENQYVNSSNNGYNSSYAMSMLKEISSPLKVVNKDISQFTVGRKVYHNKFGKGLIIAIHGGDGNEYADIAFEGNGIKSLALHIAPLEIL